MPPEGVLGPLSAVGTPHRRASLSWVCTRSGAGESDRHGFADRLGVKAETLPNVGIAPTAGDSERVHGVAAPESSVSGSFSCGLSLRILN